MQFDKIGHRLGIGVRTGDQTLETTNRGRPVKGDEVILERKHRGGVDRFADENTLDKLATFREAKNLGQGPGRGIAFKAFNRPRAQDKHAMCRLATQNFLPAEGGHIKLVPGQILRKGSRGGIADGKPLTVSLDPIAIRHAHTRGGAVPGKDDIVVRIDTGQINNLAVFGGLDRRVEFKLFHHIGDPARAKAFPSEHFNRAFAQQVPHGHFDRARIRGGYNADPVISGDAEDVACALDRGFQLGLADGGTMAAAQGRISELIKRKCGDFGTGARRETRICRPRCRSINSHECYPFR